MGPMILSIRDDERPGPNSIRKLFLPKSEGIRTKRGFQKPGSSKEGPKQKPGLWKRHMALHV